MGANRDQTNRKRRRRLKMTSNYCQACGRPGESYIWMVAAFKLLQYRYSVALVQMHECRRHFFAVRVINVWKSLPDEVVSTNQLSRFKTHIKQINVNNFLIGKA